MEAKVQEGTQPKGPEPGSVFKLRRPRPPLTRVIHDTKQVLKKLLKKN